MKPSDLTCKTVTKYFFRSSLKTIYIIWRTKDWKNNLKRQEYEKSLVDLTSFQPTVWFCFQIRFATLIVEDLQAIVTVFTGIDFDFWTFNRHGWGKKRRQICIFFLFCFFFLFNIDVSLTTYLVGKIFYLGIKSKFKNILFFNYSLYFV